MNWSLIVTIIVIAFLVFFLFWGGHRGFLKIVVTTMALVVTVGVAAILVPWFSGVLEKTVIGETIHTKIDSYLEKALEDPLVDTVRDAQDSVINNLPLPKFIKTDFKDNNTPADYVELQVTNFSDYLKTRLSALAISIVAYIILMLIIYIILRILLAISKAIQKAPVLGGINRFLGAIFGVIEGLLILWCLCLIIMVFSGTPFGSKVIEIINGSSVLKFIYNNNGILFAVNMITHWIL